jgi:hypothetical protein
MPYLRQAQRLKEEGYAVVCQRQGKLARIDRSDWLEILMDEFKCLTEDALRKEIGNPCFFYMKNRSKDTMRATKQVRDHFRPRENHSIGYVAPKVVKAKETKVLDLKTSNPTFKDRMGIANYNIAN